MKLFEAAPVQVLQMFVFLVTAAVAITCDIFCPHSVVQAMNRKLLADEMVSSQLHRCAFRHVAASLSLLCSVMLPSVSSPAVFNAL